MTLVKVDWTTDHLPDQVYRNSWDNRFRTLPGRAAITHLTPEEYRALYLKVFAVTAPEKIELVLDYGCGVGLIIPVVRELWPESIYHGVDISPEMIQYCWKECQQDDVYFHLVPEYPMIDESWPFIICHSVFTHITISDAQDLAAMLCRLLEVGGRASISIHTTEETQFFRGDWGKMEYNPATFENLIRDAGFKILGYVDDIQRFYAVERYAKS